MNQFSEAIEPCGQPEVFAQPLPVNANPIIPYNGTNLLVMGTLQIGMNYFGGPSAKLRFHKALSVAPNPIEGSTSSHTIIQGRSSALYISNNGAAYLQSDGATGPVIRCKEDASCRMPFSGGSGQVTVVDGGQGELMVGRDIVATPPVTVATFLAAPYSGRLQRAAATAGPTPGDDQSYIVDSGWDTVDATYNNGL
jgi:hypothetical protein